MLKREVGQGTKQLAVRDSSNETAGREPQDSGSVNFISPVCRPLEAIDTAGSCPTDSRSGWIWMLVTKCMCLAVGEEFNGETIALEGRCGF